MVATSHQLPTRNSLSGPQEKKQRSRRRHCLRLCVLLLLILLALGGALTLGGYVTYGQQYERDKALGNAGAQHLRTALELLSYWQKRPFDFGSVQRAQQEFHSAGALMNQVQADLQALPGVADSTPVLGTRLTAARHLVNAAQGVSQAGDAACQLLEKLAPAFRNPLGLDSQGISSADMTEVNVYFPQVRAGLLEALDNAEQLHPSDLNFSPTLARTFGTFQKNLPQARLLLDDFTELGPVLPTLLGVDQPANYLLEILDSTELRPGGGFIGNDGVATLKGGRFDGAHIQDIELLDKGVKYGSKYIAFPDQYAWLGSFLGVRSWSVRDSNLDADFPTDARYGEQNYYTEGGSVSVQGVIAITPALIQHILDITGPLPMPEYQETVTSQNLIALIHYHQLGAGREGGSLQLTVDGQTSLRKQFTELLAQRLMDRFHHLSASELGKFFGLMLSSLQSKDVQIYLNNPMAENFLQDLHIAGAMEAPVGDSLYVVDANVAGNKANAYIQTSMNDQVVLNSAGDALHHLTLTYAWNLPGHIYGTGYYRDYLRLYVPPGTTLTQQSGWTPLTSGTAFGRQYWGGIFMLLYKHQATLTFTWSVPHAALQAPGTQNWRYNYLLQRQAGTIWSSVVQVHLAQCRGLSDMSKGLLPVSAQNMKASLALMADTNLSASYTC